MKIKRKVAAVVAATIASLGLAVSIPAAADAHANSVVAVCTPDGAKVVVTLENYNTSGEDGRANSVDITIDDAVVASNADFGGSFSFSKTGLDNTVDHTYKVKVRAWDDPEGAHGWSFNQSGTIEACAKPITKVTPVAPKITQPVCTGPGQSSEGSFTVPSNTDSLKYTVDGNVVSVHVPVSQQGTTVLTDNLPDGWVAGTPGVSATYTVVYDNPGKCLVKVQPVAPTVTPGHCTTPGQSSDPTVNLATTENVTYEIKTIKGKTVVVAHPKAGYTFGHNAPDGWKRLNGHTEVFVVTFPDAPNCIYTITPEPPSVVQSVCKSGKATPSTITVQAGPGIFYAIDGEPAVGTTEVKPGEHTVTISSGDGYIFPEGTVTSYKINIKAANCVVVTPTPKPPVTTPATTPHLAFTGAFGVVQYGVGGVLLLALGVLFTFLAVGRQPKRAHRANEPLI